MIVAILPRALAAPMLPAIRAVLWRSAGLTILLFAAMAVLVWCGVRLAFRHVGWLEGGGFASVTVAAMIALVWGWLLFRAVAMAIVGLFADRIVIAIERATYPDRHATARPVPMGRSLRVSARSLLRTVGWNILALPVYGLLVVTGVGPPLLFLTLNAYLLGRDLAELVEGRHPGLPPFTAAQRWQLGFVSALLFVPPVVNLLAPVWSVAMATHMFHARPARPTP